jgi:prepilin-type N-terminal cleavage/methylation domain-containing protein
MDARLIAQGPDPTHRETGVTLIELTVVTAVLAVLAVGVSLTAIRSAAPAVETDMAWFRTQFATQQSLAIQARATRGLRISPQGLSLARRTVDGWQITAPSRPWSGRVTIADVAPRLSVGAKTAPDVILLANGQSSSFEVVFAHHGNDSRRCRSDGWTGLTCDGE